MGNQWNPLVQYPQTADDDCHLVSRLARSVKVPVPHADIASQSREFHSKVPDLCPAKEEEEEVDKLVQHWMQPTTLWDGRPVTGFMADSYLDDLRTVGFKHFNPMLTFPTTSVNQNWEPMTFGMAPWHIIEATERSQRCIGEPNHPWLSSRVVICFKHWALSIVELFYPVQTTKARRKGRPTAHRHGTMHINGNMQQSMLIYCVKPVQGLFYVKNAF